MTAVGLDVGTGGVRAVMLDRDGGLVRRVALPLPPGDRSGGGHELDEAALVATATGTLAELCRVTRRAPEAVCVSSTAGTLCFRDAAGMPAAAAVAYDDRRHGAGLARVRGWRQALPGAARVLPAGDAILEALGADPGDTDWTNALKLGWDPVAQAWPREADDLVDAGFLPRPRPPGAAAGELRLEGPARGARLVRGATDGCAMQVAAGLLPGDWTISIGTTISWRTPVPAPPAASPPGAYTHRLTEDLWLLGASGDSGGGVLAALQPGADLAELDRLAVLPSRFAAYPLARPGDRFPVCDPDFAGFGLPPADHPAFHAAILEGVGYVVRLGIERLAGAGLPETGNFRITGGAARSATWMSVLASVIRRPVEGAPDADAALGAALIALAAVRDRPIDQVEPQPTARGVVRRYEVDQGLRPSYAGGYSAFLGELTALTSG